MCEPNDDDGKSEWTDSSLWKLVHVWALPMSFAENHINTSESSSSVRAAALAAIAILVLAIVPDLQDSYSQAGFAIVIGTLFSFCLEFLSRLAGRGIPRGAIINTYGCLIVCLSLFLVLTHFDITGLIGYPVFGAGNAAFFVAALISSAITFALWLLKSYLWNKTGPRFADVLTGSVVVVLSGAFTYAMSNYKISELFEFIS